MAKAKRKLKARIPVVHLIGPADPNVPDEGFIDGRRIERSYETIVLQPGVYVQGVMEGIRYMAGRMIKGGRRAKIDPALQVELRTSLDAWYRAEQATGQRPTYGRALKEIRKLAGDRLLSVQDSTIEERIIAPVWKNFRK
jgi:hypothetical protein